MSKCSKLVDCVLIEIIEEGIPDYKRQRYVAVVNCCIGEDDNFTIETVGYKRFFTSKLKLRGETRIGHNKCLNENDDIFYTGRSSISNKKNLPSLSSQQTKSKNFISSTQQPASSNKTQQ